MSQQTLQQPKWILVDDKEGARVVPIHVCPHTKGIGKDNECEEAENNFRFVKLNLPHIAVYDRKSDYIYCPKCYELIPDEMYMIVKLSDSHKKLSERPFGGYFDFSEQPEIHKAVLCEKID